MGAGDALQRTLDRARSLVREGSTLSFRQSITLRLYTPAGDLVQSLSLEGEIRFPDAQRYKLREEWSGSALESGIDADELSLVTLDGGKSAYIRSGRLEREFGVGGWLYLREVQGKAQYLDFLQLLESTVGRVLEVKEGERETVDGRPCRRLLLSPDFQEMLEQQLDDDPLLRERLQGAEEVPEILEARSEVWVDEMDYLPLRVYSMMLLEVKESGERFEVEMRADFHSFGAELRPPLDAPAVYTVVELP